MFNLSYFSVFCMLAPLAIVVSVWFTNALAQDVDQTQMDELTDFQALVYEDGQDSQLTYRLLVPEQAQGPMPVLLFLHGAGERGDDNRQQLTHSAELLRKAARECNCIVVAPQCPDEEKWSIVDWSQGEVTFADKPSEPMRLANALVDDLASRYDVDTNRLYLIGLSMGGFGTWDAICRWPERFAAAVPICGGGDPAMAGSLIDTPIWAFHGEVDNVVPVELSRSMIRAIKEAGGNPKYTEYPGIGHASWTPAFAEPDLLSWLTSQSLSKEDAQKKQ